mmetsp:Transcript_31610/g.87215  ORF Transcript_31610/g.87215 Transcript_31610/m.87215 type:complete len:228 (+) Transcript_31610:304-987(+)
MDCDVQAVPKVLEVGLVIVIRGEVVGDEHSKRVHVEVVATLPLHYFLQLNLPVFDLEGFDGAYPRLVALLVLEPLYVRLHEGKTHEAHLHIAIHPVLDLVENTVESLHVVRLAIGYDEEEQGPVRALLAVIIDGALQSFRHSRRARRWRSKHLLQLGPPALGAKAAGAVEEVSHWVEAHNLEDAHPPSNGVPSEPPPTVKRAWASPRGLQIGPHVDVGEPSGRQRRV